MGTSKSRKQKSKAKSIARGRPPLVNSQHAPVLSSKATRTLIRKHHSLLKAHSKAVDAGDTVAADQISQQLTESDLKNYQAASKLGQSAARGGDSSKVLVDWLDETAAEDAAAERTYAVLEVGALSTTNAISRLPQRYDVTRIDLHSQGPGIMQQDFMERPLPTSSSQSFDIISLSLVLNFVGDPIGRGEMLKRCAEFLHLRHSTATSMTPALFLVLPAPCIVNSRYLTEARLEEIMCSLGFTSLRKKTTAKLYYSLFRYDAPAEIEQSEMVFKKQELVSGRSRNNFAIVL